MKLMLYFLENQNRFIPKRTLANYLEVDIRTLYRYLKLVRELTHVELTQQFGRYGYVQKAA
jgi:predicted DNA-binding transcriptional regulator YafY